MNARKSIRYVCRWSVGHIGLLHVCLMLDLSTAEQSFTKYLLFPFDDQRWEITRASELLPLAKVPLHWQYQ